MSGKDSSAQGSESADAMEMEARLEQHQQSLFVLCRNMLGQEQDAEDAAQETLLRALRALRALPRFRKGSALQTWLFRIAINICLNSKRSRARTVRLDEVPESDIRAPSPEAH